MHHYPFHPGDYLLATCHLDPMHDLAYRRLLDYYYVEEKPIPTETNWVSKRIRMPKDVIDEVLAEFFKLTEDGWRHTRCDAEIAAYYHKAEVAKANGMKGGRPKKTNKKPDRNPEETQSVILGSPKKTGYGSGSGSGSQDGKEVQEENHPPPRTAPCTIEQALAAAGNLNITPEEVRHWYDSRASDRWMKGGEGNRRAVGTEWQHDLSAFTASVRKNAGHRHNGHDPTKKIGYRDPTSTVKKQF